MRTFEVSKVEVAAKPREALDRGKAIDDLLSAPAPRDASATNEVHIRPQPQPTAKRRVDVRDWRVDT